MKRPSQLTRLIWDFYRENQEELQRLKPLAKCKVFRRWGILHIHCMSRDLAETVAEAQILLQEPIVQMRLAQKIKVSVQNMTFAVFDVKQNPITEVGY
ncbi:MAG: hypothetical protein ACFBSC_13635 [Microcoleaceae cyanobacterium]